MTERLREILYPLAMVMAVGTLWAYAWCQSVDAQVRSSWYPATDPALIDRALVADGVEARTDPDPAL